MSYLLNDKTIKVINDNLKLKLNNDCKDFNVLIYVFENYDEIINYDLTLSFYMLLKFYGHNDLFMVIDFIKYINRKIINKKIINNINPFINNNYSLFSDVIPNNLETKIEDIRNNYLSIFNGNDFKSYDYSFVYNNLLN
jgi:hypothetical protein